MHMISLLMVTVALPFAQGGGGDCFDQWTPDCSVVTLAFTGGWLHDLLTSQTDETVPAGFVPPEGAGEVILPDDDLLAECSVTPSTGQGSGVNLRASPDIDAAVIGDIPLGFYRPVTAISVGWFQTVTREGRTAFVAAEFAALVGACGDIPRFVLTSP